MKAVIAACLLTCISGCVSRYAATSFEPLFEGSAAPGKRVIVEGRVEMPGANLDSLHARDDKSDGRRCVALILRSDDRDLATANNGRVVEVRGKTYDIAEINGIFPNSSGEINGRYWGGTKCDGQRAIYVDEMRVLRQ